MVRGVNPIPRVTALARDERGQSAVLATLFVVLLLGALLGLVLFARLIRGPGPSPSFTVGPPAAVPCPIGEGAPGCFEVDVTNSGGASARVICAVEGAGGAAAEFLKGSGVYVSAAEIAPQQTIPLIAKVQAGQDEVVAAPSFNCVPSG
jgi:hypothetical protein